jgi:hypothetical protein
MELRLIHFYPDLMSLYGSYANLSVLQRRLETMGNTVTVELIVPGQSADIASADFLFMGAGTERAQKAALADFARFGEAVVISDPALARDFRYIMKQRGGMLAKGRLLGVQFDALFTDNLYFEISARADHMAEQLKATFESLGYPFFMPAQSNQLFPILPGKVRKYLAEHYTFIEMDWVDEDRRVCRFCTSWATKQENVDALCTSLEKISE